MKLRCTKYRHFLKKEITVLNLKYAYNALFFNLNSPSETVNVCTCIKFYVNYGTMWPPDYSLDLFISEFQI